MPEKLWKKIERAFCRFFGTERYLQKGKNVPDCMTMNLIIEIKHRKQLPNWIDLAWNGLLVKRDNIQRIQPDPDQIRIPILCLHKKGDGIPESLVITSAANFKYLLMQANKI